MGHHRDTHFYGYTHHFLPTLTYLIGEQLDQVHLTRKLFRLTFREKNGECFV